MRSKRRPAGGSLVNRSTSSALRLASAYVAVASVYIALSSLLVERGSASVEAAIRLELLKGLGFVLVTGAALGFFAQRWFLARTLEAERRVASERALLESERRAFAGTLSAAVAHDANNLLSVVSANLAFLRNELPPDAPEQHVIDETREAAVKLATLMRRLRDVGKPALLAPLQLRRQVEEACALARRHPDGADVQIVTDLEDLSVQGDPTLLLQMTMNLVLNAVGQPRAANGGRVMVRGVRDQRPGMIRIEVHDDGPGLKGPLDVRAYLTGKEEGTGLGLVSVLACVEALHGELEAGRSAELGGACFTVRLPEAAPMLPRS